VQIFERPAERNDPDENDIGQCLEFSVTDTGIGIEKADQNRIFCEFEQADELHNQSGTGTGLGLSLSKKLVELHGGKIWIESEGKNKGSSFRFVIPINEVNNEKSKRQ
jgi:signal transduction histidine kinase